MRDLQNIFLFLMKKNNIIGKKLNKDVKKYFLTRKVDFT